MACTKSAPPPYINTLEGPKNETNIDSPELLNNKRTVESGFVRLEAFKT